MPAYTVHEPQPRDGEAKGPPERFVFVRDGFSFSAFLFTALWMVFRRLWLVLLLYVAVTATLQIVLAYAGMPGGVRVLAGVLVAFLVGLEAGTLRRWTLNRRKWRMLGFVVGEDRESAERRFYASWLATARTPAAMPPPPSATGPASRPAPRAPKDDGDIIGLFPQPVLPR